MSTLFLCMLKINNVLQKNGIRASFYLQLSAGPDKSAGLLAQIYCDAIYFIQNLAHVIFTLRKCVVFFKYYAVWGHKELDML